MTKTTYTVVGSTPFMDVQPGETFEADLDDELAERAIEQGRIAKGKTKKEEEK
jgi:hypothetical protein